MLANKYFDKPEKLKGQRFAITTKLDGFRLIAIKDGSGNVSFYSRVGKRIEGLVEIEEEFRSAFPTGCVFDGELTISNYFELESKEAYKAASKIISQKGETSKTGLTYRVFDVMYIDEWRTQNCTHTYDERRNLLEGLFGYAAVPIPHIELLPILYRGDDTSKVTEWLDKITAEGGEGVMINLLNSPYRFTRCWDIMKVKKFQSLDLEVIGVEEGSGRLAGTLGAILVRYKGGNAVRVGSGFSDEERMLYWANHDLILHKVVEIKYFESSRNADGQESLRFPTWVSNIRDPRDKATPDF
jgi:DNA ligase-1